MLARLLCCALSLLSLGVSLNHSQVLADDGSDKPGLSMAAAAQKPIDVLPAGQKQKLIR
jgi:hypothetical protein